MYYVLNGYVKGQNMEYLPTEIVDKYNFFMKHRLCTPFTFRNI